MNEFLGIPKEVKIVSDSYNESGEMEFVQGFYEDKNFGQTFDIFFLRTKNVRNAVWLVGKVENAGKEIWSFKNSNFSGRAQMFVVNTVPVLAEVNRYNVVKQIVCLTDLGNTQVVTDGKSKVLLGGYTFKEKIVLKQEVARQNENLDFSLTETEKAFLAKEKAKKDEVKARIQAQKQAQKRERKRKIMSRPVIVVYSAKSEKLYGKPVTNEEWQVLPIGDKGVLVDAYNDETGQYGKPLEAFMVIKAKKGGGKERRVRSTELFLEKPGTNHVPIKVQAIFDFMVGHELAHQVPVIDHKDLGKFAKKFNSGTRVALPLPEKGKYQIYELTHGKPRALCEAEPI